MSYISTISFPQYGLTISITVYSYGINHTRVQGGTQLLACAPRPQSSERENLTATLEYDHSSKDHLFIYLYYVFLCVCHVSCYVFATFWQCSREASQPASHTSQSRWLPKTSAQQGSSRPYVPYVFLLRSCYVRCTPAVLHQKWCLLDQPLSYKMSNIQKKLGHICIYVYYLFLSKSMTFVLCMISTLVEGFD